MLSGLYVYATMDFEQIIRETSAAHFSLPNCCYSHILPAQHIKPQLQLLRMPQSKNKPQRKYPNAMLKLFLPSVHVYWNHQEQETTESFAKTCKTEIGLNVCNYSVKKQDPA